MLELSWDEYFVRIAKTVSLKSHCLSIQRGCVLVKDKQILSTGYNGPPAGFPHCNEMCPRKEMGFKSGEGLEWCPASHSEANSIVQAARNGVKIENTILYCSFSHIPCRECSKLIINAGIKEVVLFGDIKKYQEPGLKGEKLLKDVGIIVRGVMFNEKA